MEKPEVPRPALWSFTVASGRWEVYVRPFPRQGPRTQVTLDGGVSPGWNQNGRELFFVKGGSGPTPTVWSMNVVDMDVTRGVRVGATRRLFEFSNLDLYFLGSPRCYEVSPDGQRSYVPKSVAPLPPAPVVTHINLIQNWFEELKAKVPAGVAK